MFCVFVSLQKRDLFEISNSCSRSFSPAGLLDVPICAVNDSGYFANPRYTVNFPPNAYDQNRIKSYSKYFNVPVNAINVNSQRWPIDTINGLKYFMGKPLNMRIYRENALPHIGIGRSTRLLLIIDDSVSACLVCRL